MKTPSFITSSAQLTIAPLSNLKSVSPLRRIAMRSLIPATHVAAFSSFAKATFRAIRKAALLRFLIAALLASGAVLVHAQSALDGFNPSAGDYVSAIVVQPNGKILLGGNFTTLSPNGGVPVTRKHIARLNTDGTLDAGFDPNTDNRVHAIALQQDGKILIGGEFTTLSPNGGGPVTSNHLARLNTDGTLDHAFPDVTDPLSSCGCVYAIAVQPDKKILIGGLFVGIGGQTRNRIARLNEDGSLDTAFNPNADSFVFAIVLQTDGKILVGGNFDSIGGHGANEIARLNADGTYDTTFASPNLVGPAQDSIFSIAVQPDGKIVIGGSFEGAGGQPRTNIARLNTNGTLDNAFQSDANQLVRSIAVQADGKILVGGDFGNIGGQPRSYLARLDSTTGSADSFNPNPNGSVSSIAVQPDGKILVGGGFNGANSIGGQTRNFIARLEKDGRLDQTLNLSTVGSVVGLTAVQPDGKILIGGIFSSVLGVPRNNIARLNTDGTLDTVFNPNANAGLRSIVVQAGGKILAGGFFTNIGGQPRNFIARLDGTTGAADSSFNPNANNLVESIAVQADGKILVGGTFSGANSIGGQTRNRIARLDATGPNTGLADSFNPNASSTVWSMALQADGKILVGGLFFGPNSIGGQTRNSIARLNATTGFPDSFDPNPNGSVDGIAVLADGKILVGGDFTTIGGQSRSLFARLSNDTAALQNLAVTQATITWTRGGSSPQFTRVTFEYATNGNYNPLDDGAAAGSNWTLAGLSFPLGQNIYIRARGYYRGGFYNDSESITESVRYAFISLPPTPTALVSRKMHGAAPFDIPLFLTGSPRIECRTGGASGNHQVIATFFAPVTFTFAAVTSGTGSVASATGNGTTAVTVNLTGVTNAQKITITLFGLSDGTNTNTGNLGIPMGVLLGDTTGNGSVSASDISQTKSKSGQPVGSSNFRADVTVNNSINASDVALVKSKSGTGLP
jgi:uncharacterized delta-60 repeat protein